jgi:hypothetical protein
MSTLQDKFIIERVQTGVRLEKRLLKVLKAFAELHDLNLGDLLEGIVLHAFDGKTPFSEESRHRISELKKFYGLDLDSRASHKLTEAYSRENSIKHQTTTRQGSKSKTPAREGGKKRRPPKTHPSHAKTPQGGATR